MENTNNNNKNNVSLPVTEPLLNNVNNNKNIDENFYLSTDGQPLIVDSKFTKFLNPIVEQAMQMVSPSNDLNTFYTSIAYTRLFQSRLEAIDYNTHNKKENYHVAPYLMVQWRPENTTGIVELEETKRLVLDDNVVNQNDLNESDILKRVYMIGGKPYIRTIEQNKTIMSQYNSKKIPRMEKLKDKEELQAKKDKVIEDIIQNPKFIKQQNERILNEQYFSTPQACAPYLPLQQQRPIITNQSFRPQLLTMINTNDLFFSNMKTKIITDVNKLLGRQGICYDVGVGPNGHSCAYVVLLSLIKLITTEELSLNTLQGRLLHVILHSQTTIKDEEEKIFVNRLLGKVQELDALNTDELQYLINLIRIEVSIFDSNNGGIVYHEKWTKYIYNNNSRFIVYMDMAHYQLFIFTQFNGGGQTDTITEEDNPDLVDSALAYNLFMIMEHSEVYDSLDNTSINQATYEEQNTFLGLVWIKNELGDEDLVKARQNIVPLWVQVLLGLRWTARAYWITRTVWDFLNMINQFIAPERSRPWAQVLIEKLSTLKNQIITQQKRMWVNEIKRVPFLKNPVAGFDTTVAQGAHKYYTCNFCDYYDCGYKWGPNAQQIIDSITNGLVGELWRNNPTRLATMNYETMMVFLQNYRTIQGTEKHSELGLLLNLWRLACCENVVSRQISYYTWMEPDIISQTHGGFYYSRWFPCLSTNPIQIVTLHFSFITWDDEVKCRSGSRPKAIDWQAKPIPISMGYQNTDLITLILAHFDGPVKQVFEQVGMAWTGYSCNVKQVKIIDTWRTMGMYDPQITRGSTDNIDLYVRLVLMEQSTNLSGSFTINNVAYNISDYYSGTAVANAIITGWTPTSAVNSNHFLNVILKTVSQADFEMFSLYSKLMSNAQLTPIIRSTNATQAGWYSRVFGTAFNIPNTSNMALAIANEMSYFGQSPIDIGSRNIVKFPRFNEISHLLVNSSYIYPSTLNKSINIINSVRTDPRLLYFWWSKIEAYLFKNCNVTFMTLRHGMMPDISLTLQKLFDKLNKTFYGKGFRITLGYGPQLPITDYPTHQTFSMIQECIITEKARLYKVDILKKDTWRLDDNMHFSIIKKGNMLQTDSIGPSIVTFMTNTNELVSNYGTYWPYQFINTVNALCMNTWSPYDTSMQMFSTCFHKISDGQSFNDETYNDLWSLDNMDCDPIKYSLFAINSESINIRSQKFISGSSDRFFLNL